MVKDSVVVSSFGNRTSNVTFSVVKVGTTGGDTVAIKENTKLSDNLISLAHTNFYLLMC